MAKAKEFRDARMAEHRAKMQGKKAESASGDTAKVAAADAPKPAPATSKITGYRDANGRMHFTDGTDSASQGRMR